MESPKQVRRRGGSFDLTESAASAITWYMSASNEMQNSTKTLIHLYEISVEDYGGGLTEAEEATVFNPFAETKAGKVDDEKSKSLTHLFDLVRCR
jgi:signal transduction histidine kinase